MSGWAYFYRDSHVPSQGPGTPASLSLVPYVRPCGLTYSDQSCHDITCGEEVCLKGVSHIPSQGSGPESLEFGDLRPTFTRFYLESPNSAWQHTCGSVVFLPSNPRRGRVRELSYLHHTV